MSIDLSRLIDRLEPFMDESSGLWTKYYGNVNETIEEEEDDALEVGQNCLLSPEMFNKLKA